MVKLEAIKFEAYKWPQREPCFSPVSGCFMIWTISYGAYMVYDINVASIDDFNVTLTESTSIKNIPEKARKFFDPVEKFRKLYKNDLSGREILEFWQQMPHKIFIGIYNFSGVDRQTSLIL